MNENTEGITIVIPIFNEVAGMARLLPAFEDYISQSKFEVNLLLVNDGSTDNSLLEIKKIAEIHQHVGYLSF